MNFQTTDKLRGHLHNCVTFLTWRKFDEAIKLKERWPDLFSELVQITNSSLSEEEKRSKRIMAFASNYKKPGDVEYGEEMLRYTFDQEAVISQARRYLAGQEPTIADIEKEFWINCSNINDVNKLCNVYRERWTGSLYEVDTDYYDWNNFLFNNAHELNANFKVLRDCGLLTSNVTELECTLHHLAEQVNRIVKRIVEFFTAMRRTTIDTNDLIKPDDYIKVNGAEIEHVNNFNDEPLTEVRKHFNLLCRLTCKTKGNKRPLLTPEQLEEFILNAFILTTPPAKKIKINRGLRDTSQIVSVFHAYFSITKVTNVYQTRTKNDRADYIKLLTDYFIGYEYDVIAGNFRS